ncbi:hypothetical protein CRG98_007435 [Punica granatum]|uniref:Uncharacterized protein n=1 Tax=Punica granatum TaxID=22663 RepID=A0A2I0KWD1_PUNGR|nr:hypothetical protein CRG98_007435 [Punica granatum]
MENTPELAAAIVGWYGWRKANLRQKIGPLLWLAWETGNLWNWQARSRAARKRRNITYACHIRATSSKYYMLSSTAAKIDVVGPKLTKCN